MTKKVLDWSALKKGEIFDSRPVQKGAFKNIKQAFDAIYANQEAVQQHQAQVAATEPELKKSLLGFMLDRKPIVVRSPFKNPTETLDGRIDGADDEDDGFYSNVKKSNTEHSSFREVMETIPAGISLVFKSLDKTLGQWIFKGSNGKEYAIYTNPTVMFQNSWIRNPGFYGLLYNTEISEKVTGEE